MSNQSLREAAQQALEALKIYVSTYNDYWERGMEILEPIGEDAISRLEAALAQPEVKAQPDFGLRLEQINKMRSNSLKPEEIAADADELRHARVTELVRWFARLADGDANPKWLRGHAFELAYHVATNDLNRSIDLHAITQAAFVNGVNIPPADRAMLERLGVVNPPAEQPFRPSLGNMGFMGLPPDLRKAIEQTRPVAWMARFTNADGKPDVYVTTHLDLAIENDANGSPRPLGFIDGDQLPPAEQCNIDEFSSRICEHGTQSCTVRHEPPAEQGADLTSNGLTEQQHKDFLRQFDEERRQGKELSDDEILDLDFDMQDGCIVSGRNEDIIRFARVVIAADRKARGGAA